MSRSRFEGKFFNHQRGTQASLSPLAASKNIKAETPSQRDNQNLMLWLITYLCTKWKHMSNQERLIFSLLLLVAGYALGSVAYLLRQQAKCNPFKHLNLNENLQAEGILTHNGVTTWGGLKHEEASLISECLNQGPVVIESNQNLTIYADIHWDNPSNSLTLTAKENIIFKPGAYFDCAGDLFLKSGIRNSQGEGKVIFEDATYRAIKMHDHKIAEIHYNPSKPPKERHKYLTGDDYFLHVTPPGNQESYLLVNNVYDLANIRLFLSRNYALSQDIDASVTKHWNGGKGFEPLYGKISGNFFYGNFYGNGFAIRGLYINRPDESKVGLFTQTVGYPDPDFYSEVKDLVFEDCYIRGDQAVGTFTGVSGYYQIHNVTVRNSTVIGNSYTGGLVGYGYFSRMRNIQIKNNRFNISAGCIGEVAGGGKDMEIDDPVYIGCK